MAFSTDSQNIPGGTRALPRGQLISCLLCFRHGASAAKAGVPRTGRRVQSNLNILSWAVEMGQCKAKNHSSLLPKNRVLGRWASEPQAVEPRHPYVHDFVRRLISASLSCTPDCTLRDSYKARASCHRTFASSFSPVIPRRNANPRIAFAKSRGGVSGSLR